MTPTLPSWRRRRPLLIAQGANDPRVTQKESDQIVAAMEAKKIPVTYVVYADEGHGFAKKANADFLFYASVEFVRVTLLK